LSSFERNWKFLTADGYASSHSYQLFQNAIAYANQEFQQASPHFRTKEPGYALIDIDAARHAGIAAIPRS
jgi:hypothetical protein